MAYTSINTIKEEATSAISTSFTDLMQNYSSFITDHLITLVNGKDFNSYSGTGTDWYDLSPHNKDFTIHANLAALWDNTNKCFTVSGGSNDSVEGITITNPTTMSDCTLGIYLKTTTIQGILWSYGATSYVGAYEDYRIRTDIANWGSATTYWLDGVDHSTNIWTLIPDNNWHLIELKGLDFTTLGGGALGFRLYGQAWSITDFSIGGIYIYSKSLSGAESLQNKSYFSR
jgi:hypothetical protein